MASTLSSLLKPILLSLALEIVLDAVAQSLQPEMLSLDLTSVMLFSPDLSPALQVCLSGSSSCAHPFSIVAALCLTLLFFSFHIHPALSFTSVASQILYIPKSLVFIRCLLLSSVVTTSFLNIIRTSLLNIHSCLYLFLFSAAPMDCALHNFVFLLAPTRIL